MPPSPQWRKCQVSHEKFSWQGKSSGRGHTPDTLDKVIERDCHDFMVMVLWTRHFTLQWRHNGRGGVSNHQPHDCLPNRSFGRRSKKTPKLRVTGLCAWNSLVTGEFPAQRASNAENVFIWWRHHGLVFLQSTHGSWFIVLWCGLVIRGFTNTL